MAAWRNCGASLETMVRALSQTSGCSRTASPRLGAWRGSAPPRRTTAGCPAVPTPVKKSVITILQFTPAFGSIGDIFVPGVGTEQCTTDLLSALSGTEEGDFMAMDHQMLDLFICYTITSTVAQFEPCVDRGDCAAGMREALRCAQEEQFSQMLAGHPMEGSIAQISAQNNCTEMMMNVSTAVCSMCMAEYDDHGGGDDHQGDDGMGGGGTGGRGQQCMTYRSDGACGQDSDCAWAGHISLCLPVTCTAPNMPYDGCIDAECTATDTPYAGCMVPTCTAVNTPFAGCTNAVCTAADTPYAGCTPVGGGR